MKRLEFNCSKVKDKPFHIENGMELKVKLQLLPPGKYLLIVQKEYKKASTKQFGWLYNSVYPLSLIALNDAGYEFTTIEEVDMFWKSLYASKEVLIRETGEIRIIPATKAEFLTMDHCAYTANIRYHCSMYLNCDIPDPKINWKELKNKLNYENITSSKNNSESEET